MNGLENQIKLLKDQGYWIKQQCSEWIDKATQDFYKNKKVNDTLLKQGKELLGRSKQWCKDVKNKGLI